MIVRKRQSGTKIRLTTTVFGFLILLLGTKPAVSQVSEKPTDGMAKVQEIMGTPLELRPIPEELTGTEVTGTNDTESREEMMSTGRTVLFFAAMSLAPIAILMSTAFVRIQIVLLLLRQALGSPQVPGNQVITALALLLTLVVMAPSTDRVYRQAIQPYLDGTIGEQEAWEQGSRPIKQFMVEQVYRTHHEYYFTTLYNRIPQDPDTAPAQAATDAMDLPLLTVIAPGYLISELTTALWIGFALYLPFVVIDLVVSSILSAAGLIMLPPSQVALPLKLGLFVIADGWFLVADALLRTFMMPDTGGV